MCGIFGLLSNNIIAKDAYYSSFMKGKSRGPEFSELKDINNNLLFGFHRLAINGLDEISNQPLTIENNTLICNGEIYNYKDLYNTHNFEAKTNSDCEIIIHMYEKYGIEFTLRKLDGVFAFLLWDNEKKILHCARDPLGVRPLYILEDDDTIAFGSEIKVLNNLKKNFTINHFEPGTFSCYHLNETVDKNENNTRNTSFFSNDYQSYKWNIIYKNIEYHEYLNKLPVSFTDLDDLSLQIRNKLISSVKKRVLTTDRPIACLLSGGLDSSLICALVQREVNFLFPDKKIETFSIGLLGSEDLIYAEKTAEYIGTKHTSIVLGEYDFLNSIPDVVKNVETFDTTTIRASVGNYLVSKYISENSDAKVIFNGDGADELMGGYMYFHACPSNDEFDKECKNLLNNIHNYDVLRSDKSISSCGLEARTPFLDRSWVRFYLSIPINLRNHNIDNNIEKFLIRNAFNEPLDFANGERKKILPKEVLWRRKKKHLVMVLVNKLDLGMKLFKKQLI